MEDNPSTIEHSPRSFVDRRGRRIRLEIHPPDSGVADIDQLTSMYQDLDGRCRAMGIPPVRADELEAWLETLGAGRNILAWYDNRVVGHAGILHDGNGGHELAIFVHQDFQDAGIGTELCRTLIDYARERGVDRIWLSVAAGNEPATHIFRTVGFETIDRSHQQLKMAMDLG